MSARSGRSEQQAQKLPISASEQGDPSERVLGPQRSPEGSQELIAAELLTAGELAQRWRVPKSQVYRLTREGKVPVVQLGRYFRYRAADITEWEKGGGTNA